MELEADKLMVIQGPDRIGCSMLDLKVPQSKKHGVGCYRIFVNSDDKFGEVVNELILFQRNKA